MATFNYQGEVFEEEGIAAFIGQTLLGTTLERAVVTGDFATDLALFFDGIGDTFNLSSRDDFVWAGAGDDFMLGSGLNGFGNDDLRGGGGNDRIEGGVGGDHLEGGDGSDWLYYQNSSGGVRINLFANTASNGEAAGDSINGFENVSGSSRGDTLTGNDAANELNGNDGNDVISGGLGANFLRGGQGDDTYILGDGADEVVEVSGFDTVRFTHASTINFQAGNSAGDPSNDLWNDTFIERFEGSSGADVIILTIAGGDRKEITGGGGNDILGGRAADDAISGDAGNDAAYGRDGADTLRGGNGRDQLFGDSGNDLIEGGSGNDLIDGGLDIDTASFVDHFGNVSGGWVIDLIAQTATTRSTTGTVQITETDTLSGIENAIGSVGNDTIHAAAVSTINGGDGLDTLWLAPAWFLGELGFAANDTVNLQTRISFSGGTNCTFSGIEVIHTGIGDDIVTGSTGGDKIFGDGGADNMNGAGGNDIIDGGTGTDRLFGGTGLDTLTGGAEADRFYFDTAATAANADTITDFVHGIDDIYLQRSSFVAIGVALNASELRLGAAAVDGNDFIIYDSASGRIYYDADGSGAVAKQLVATITIGTVLTISDFAMF